MPKKQKQAAPALPLPTAYAPRFRARVSGCVRCAALAERREQQGFTPYVADTNLDAGILLVGDNPTDEETIASVGFEVTGTSVGTMALDAAISAAGLRPDEYALTFAVRCPAELSARSKLGKREIEACSPWLAEEFYGYEDLRVVVCLGRLATAMVLGVPLTKVKDARGKIHRAVLGGRDVLVVASVHPYQAATSVFDAETLRFDLRRARTLALPGYELFDPERHAQVHAETYRVVTPGEAHAVVDRLLGAELVAFDTETRGLDPWAVEGPYLVTVQFSDMSDEAFVFVLAHPEYGPPDPTLREEVTRFFEEYQGKLAAFNAKFDQVAVLHDLGVLPRVELDVMVVDYLARSSSARGLKKLAWEVSPFGGYEDMVKMPEGGDTTLVPLAPLVLYAATDADVTYRGALEALDVLSTNSRVYALSRFLSDASAVLARVEHSGWCIDLAYLEQYGATLESRISNLTGEVRRLFGDAVVRWEARTGEEWSPASTKALGEVLYQECGAPVLRRTEKGAPSTDRVALTELKDVHPAIPKLLELRKVAKARDAFYERWKAGLAPDGRLHFRYNLVKFRDEESGVEGGTSSGRLSSSGSAGNIQQVSKDPELRRVFLPDDNDSVILDVDFSTLEYVVAAIHSRDPVLCEAFRRGYDVHAATAAALFGGKPEDMVKPENKPFRQKAKVLNFSLLYGGGPPTVSRQLGISETEAEQLITEHNAQFPRVHAWMEERKRFIRRSGFCESKFGRRRLLPDARLSGPGMMRLKQAALRAGINMPIQADASDICLWGLIRVDRWLRETGKRARVLATIHDSIVLSVPIGELEEVYYAVVDTLTHPGLDWLDGVKGPGVPLRVSASAGVNWGEMEELRAQQ